MPSSQTWLICHTNPYALVLFVTVSYFSMMCHMVLNTSQAADLPFSWIPKCGDSLGLNATC